MQRVVYCGRFYCKYCEGGECLSPVLHLGQGLGCAEFSPSEEKFDQQMALLDEKQRDSPPKPVEYRFEDGTPNAARRIRTAPSPPEKIPRSPLAQSQTYVTMALSKKNRDKQPWEELK